MSRAAILPYPGDPFLLHYWLMHFDKYWRDEVNTLYVYHNSTVEPKVFKYIREMCQSRENIVFLSHPNQIEHGEAINKTLDYVQEKYLMLVEDDAFIFKPGIVNECFDHLESGRYDIVGSRRGSCGLKILKAAQRKWGLDYTGVGDRGPNFWPCYFFSEADLLRKTDRNFCARAWKSGERIEPLGMTVDNDEPIVTSDTFVNTSLQLRDMVPGHRILHIPQYHGHPDDKDHWQERKFLWDGKAPWCHIGSLSSGIAGILRDGENRPLARRKLDPPAGDTILPHGPTSDFEKREYERRVQWWLSAWETRDPQKIEEFAELYRVAINVVIEQFGLSKKRIKQRQHMYRELGIL